MYCDILSFRASEHRQLLYGHNLKGIHPWDLKEGVTKEELDNLWNDFLQEIAPLKFDAIGECGIDRVRPHMASIEMQMELLHRHFTLAKKMNLSLVLHIVRSYSDLLSVLKKAQPKAHFVLHAFNGNEIEIEKLMKYKAYFSLGKSLFSDDHKELIKKIPLDRLLLETGDQTKHSLEEIYQQAADLLGIDEPILREKIESNFLEFLSQPSN